MHGSSPNRLSRLLALAGFAMAAGFALASFWLRGGNGAADVGRFLALFGGLCLLYLAAVSICLRLPGGERRTLRGIFLAAALFRLLMLPAGLSPEARWEGARADLGSSGVGFERFLLYDQDLWRYLWDGHVLASGLDPYAHTLEEWEDLAYAGDARAEELFAEALWEEIYENVAYQEYLTVYPPLAQAFFASLHLLAPGSVLLLKGALALCDLASCWLLLQLLRQLSLRRELVVLYAWNPLAIKEYAGSGHIDALGIPLLLAATLLLLRGRGRLSLVALGLAILAKLTPAVAAPLFLLHCRPRAWPWLAATVGLGYLPFLSSWREILGGLADFGAGWTFNPGLWLAVQRAVEALVPGRGAAVASALWLLVTLALLAWLLRRSGGLEALPGQVYLLLAVFFLLSPAVMPWYLLWALPFAVLARSRAWVVFTCLAFLTYLIYVDGVERAWWLALGHGTAWALLARELWARREALRP